ncbi:hypothetical protein V8G54_012902 [Vigna mungo]|uniref:Uncharacterized protein n=1 Tax=Vigna mungo TaxID=3915 RepID=A0AAQ3NUN0_VIGMU
MIMHPHLENLSCNSNTFTKPFNLIIHLSPLQLPPQLLCKRQHLLLLLRTELSPEPLPAAPLSHLHSSNVSSGVFHHIPAPSTLQTFHRTGTRHFAMEVAVTTASCTLEGGRGDVDIESELSATISSVTTETRCMVAETLSIHRV